MEVNHVRACVLLQRFDLVCFKNMTILLIVIIVISSLTESRNDRNLVTVVNHKTNTDNKRTYMQILTKHYLLIK